MRWYLRANVEFQVAQALLPVPLRSESNRPTTSIFPISPLSPPLGDALD